MYRSASTNRVVDDHHLLYHPSSSSSAATSASASASSSKGSTTLRALSLEANELPVYESMSSEAAKKERSRDIMAQNAVHIIPLVLLLCAVILWFLSTPDIDMSGKGGITSARVEGLGAEIDGDSDGTQKGDIPFDLDDLSVTTKQEDHESHRKFLTTKLP